MIPEEAVEVILHAEAWDPCDECGGQGLSPEPGGGGSADALGGPGGYSVVSVSCYGGGGGGGGASSSPGGYASTSVVPGGGGGGSSRGGSSWTMGIGVGGISGGSSGGGGVGGVGSSQQFFRKCSHCSGTGKQLKPLYAEACHVLGKPLPSPSGGPELKVTVG